MQSIDVIENNLNVLIEQIQYIKESKQFLLEKKNYKLIPLTLTENQRSNNVNKKAFLY